MNELEELQADYENLRRYAEDTSNINKDLMETIVRRNTKIDELLERIAELEGLIEVMDEEKKMTFKPKATGEKSC